MVYYAAQMESGHVSLSALDRRCANLFFYWDVSAAQHSCGVQCSRGGRGPGCAQLVPALEDQPHFDHDWPH